MYYQLKRQRIWAKRYMVLFFVLVVLLFCNSVHKWKFEFEIEPSLLVLISTVSALFMFNEQKQNGTVNIINGVKPIWKFLSVDSEIEYFSLDRSKSVVDNVRYYSLIVDDKHKIKSIRQFYFSDNAIAKSEEIYQLNLSPLFSEHDTQSKPQAKLNIIKATTIYGDDTYFFEGDGLSGGLTKINGEYNPYSGNWDSDSDKECKLTRATNYLDQLEEKNDKNDKQDKGGVVDTDENQKKIHKNKDNKG